jgi:preprotein translocase subunit SecD
VTTLVAALFLFGFGTGPVKGFAVTLTIGIVVSMFTAVFVTRIIFDHFIWDRKIERISI